MNKTDREVKLCQILAKHLATAKGEEYSVGPGENPPDCKLFNNEGELVGVIEETSLVPADIASKKKEKEFMEYLDQELNSAEFLSTNRLEERNFVIKISFTKTNRMSVNERDWLKSKIKELFLKTVKDTQDKCFRLKKNSA